MEIFPYSFRRGDSLEGFEGSLLGGIGAFSKACVGGRQLHQPLEVLLVEGSPVTGLRARVGDSAHYLYEGLLTSATVSFTLEAFRTPELPGFGEKKIVEAIQEDSRTFCYEAAGELRHFIFDQIGKDKISGALLYIQGTARHLKVYGHTDTKKLNNDTKTFDEIFDRVGIEGWGNLSFIDGRTPFIHLHGTYEGRGLRKGGHFIMDDRTPLMIEKATLLVYPFSSLVRSYQAEDFPVWKV